MSDTKFTKEEMNQINELQKSYAGLQNALGQISVSRIRLEQQMTELDSAEDTIRTKFTETQSQEKDFVQSINKKYGDGNLDLGTGVFTPKSVEQTEEKTDKTL
tara:strand:+ start:679 stop:987 length:309 start_codon:yes stop_codon:yes gene_type:complete